MRTIEMNVYQYHELSDAAKEKARSWYLEGADDTHEYEFDEHGQRI